MATHIHLDQNTTTMFMLVDRSIVAHEGIIEDVMVSIEYWEYPTNFLVLQPKIKCNGYPLIIGIPLLATVNSYINCMVRNMTTKNGHLSKQLCCILLLKLLLNMI